MNTIKIHHIGYLVKKIESAVVSFEKLGFTLTDEITYDEIRKVNICFMEKGGYMIELVSPVSSDSVVAGLIKKYKSCPYHICYESEQFDATLKSMTENGYTAIDNPTPAPAFGGRKVVFLMSPTIGMVELLESIDSND